MGCYHRNMELIIELGVMLARRAPTSRGEGGSYFSKACLLAFAKRFGEARTKLSQRSQVFKEEYGVLPSEYAEKI